jgi:hypothetical protein
MHYREEAYSMFESFQAARERTYSTNASAANDVARRVRLALTMQKHPDDLPGEDTAAAITHPLATRGNL